MLCSTSLKTFRSFPNKERASTKERSHSPDSFGHMAAHLSFSRYCDTCWRLICKGFSRFTLPGMAQNPQRPVHALLGG